MSKNSKNRNQPNMIPPSHAAVARVTQSVQFSGPLPPPGLLEKYNEVIPNGAERIMAMAEKQGAHRESLEAQVVAANIANQARGSRYAFILCLVALLGGFALIMVGKDVYGLGSIITSITALAGVFIYARREQRKERIEKADALLARKHN